MLFYMWSYEKVIRKAFYNRPLRLWLEAAVQFYSFFNLDGGLSVGFQHHLPRRGDDQILAECLHMRTVVAVM